MLRRFLKVEEMGSRAVSWWDFQHTMQKMIETITGFGALRISDESFAHSPIYDPNYRRFKMWSHGAIQITTNHMLHIQMGACTAIPLITRNVTKFC